MREVSGSSPLAPKEKFMRIAIASDHAGFYIKNQLVEMLSKEYKVIDFGTFSDISCDYPDYAVKVAKAVKNNQADKGILICATAEGMCIVANKFKGIRAGVCYSDDVAKLLAEHNFVNIICFPSRITICGSPVSIEMLYKWTKIWLETKNSSEQRHINRIEKIKLIEKENFK